MMDANALPPIWNIPYQRNPFFTGREEVLDRLHDELRAEHAAALAQPQGVSGLGGIGKTQAALEYAYRYHNDYQAVLWARADSTGVLTSEFVNIAHLLQLSEKDEQDQNLIVEAVMRWLRVNSQWLLILDNIENLAVTAPFIPLAGCGHILLTTRLYSMSGMAQRIEMEKMYPEIGALLLLRRAGFLATEHSLDVANNDDRIQAMEISRIVDGLPLALDQAGAYIKETHCTLVDYLVLYRIQNAKLLKESRVPGSYYPESVATTWSLSFEKLSQTNPAATELLCLFAFLYSDAIPEEIITDGSPNLGTILQPVATDPIQLDNAIKEILRFSLLHREPDTQTFTVHRLVQAVLKDRMGKDKQRQWVERSIRAVNDAFPEVEFATWFRYQRCILHAQACMEHIEQWEMRFPEAARLLNQAGYYLQERAQYTQATPFLERAVAIREATLGSDHLDVSQSLNNLAEVYFFQDEYILAESLFLRALLIREQALGLNHPSVAETLNDLGRLYLLQGQYAKAEPLYQRSLTIRKEALGLDHRDVVESLNNLARLYYLQGRRAEAEQSFLSALEICERILEPNHPDVALIIDNLALLYQVQGRYIESETLYQRALTIREQILGKNNPLVANTLHDLALLYRAQGKYTEAEPILQKARTVYEQAFGSDHTYVASSLNNLALLYRAQGKYTEAESLFQRAREIYERTFGSEHPYVATTLRNLASIYDVQGDYAQADLLYKRALAIREQALGLEHPDVASVLEGYAKFLRKTNRGSEAEKMENRAKSIRAQ